jgi:hypothetical protein
MPTDEKRKEQEKQAKQLRARIAKLLKGELPDAENPQNPRDFIAKRMREIEEEDPDKIEID